MVHILIETSEKNSNEGQFIRQFADHVKSGASVDIVPVGGRKNIDNLTEIMRDYSDSGDTVLVIFDCDSVLVDNGGIVNRRNEMEKRKNNNGLNFDCFFFPDNESDGEFEDLLIKIINPKHAGLMSCFDRYENCLSKLPHKNSYELPDSKKKIYDYIASFRRSQSQRDTFKNNKDWGFNNPEYWDLDSPALDPLKDFLIQYL